VLKDDKLNNPYFLIIITKIGNSRTLHKFFPEYMVEKGGGRTAF
jgi:hypothetical protein